MYALKYWGCLELVSARCVIEFTSFILTYGVELWKDSKQMG
jgi:hypothetical protein